MGSLPDLTERSRPSPVGRTASRTVSDPHRHRAVIPQIPVSTICKKEWLWKKPKTPSRVAQPAVVPRRRDSAASSLGAASVRKLLTRQPPKVPKPIVNRFTLLCLSSGLCATALLPFTAFAGAEAAAMPLALMHSIAAVIAPFSPLILQKLGARIVITIAHILVFILITAHTVATPLSWYGVCVGGWSCAWRALFGAGCLQALAAATLSMAAARGRRGALAAGGAAAHASLMLALLRWRAARTDLALPAVAAAAWGACAALWDVLQVGACVGGAGWRGPWAATLGARHVGLAAACAARQFVCVRAQLATLAAALAAALLAHAALELRLRRGEAGRHRS
ncbi:uncharacterized protein LOC131848199 [Achroia grisella]|uniref:uncharacterized protein LOC131848199 n=1 Tax=Achroia grisella TaxID=688607 RepID=UPI0027D20B3C|nr:uncharacterized protein LOC131848199 [Achroia grisella]